MLDWRIHKLLILNAALLTSCAPRGVPLATGSTHRNVAPVQSAPSGNVSLDAPKLETICPPIDVAQLEPLKPVADARVIELSDVFSREEARPTGVATSRIDLGQVSFDRNPISGDRSGDIFGMGWSDDPTWLIPELGPDVAAGLKAWSDAMKERSDQLGKSDGLVRRINSLSSIAVGDGGVDLRCATQALAEANDRAGTAASTAAAAASRLVILLENAKARSAAEKVVLGDMLSLPPVSTGAVARPLALFKEVANDPSVSRELRTHAMLDVARLSFDLGDNEHLTESLKSVVTLTKNRDIEIDALTKLADLSRGDEPAREKLLLQALAVLERSGHDYRLALTLGELAEIRLHHGAFDGARDAAVRCAREVRRDFSDNPDPWNCATSLAEALAELGGADHGIEVPLAFLGPLSLAIIESAIERMDRDEAKHVGELLLARLPEAPEAPRVVTLLASIAPNPDTRAALNARRASDYGPASAWLVSQRVRLAPSSPPPALDKEIAQLLSPPNPLGTPPPADAASVRVEALERIDQVINMCHEELEHGPHQLTVHVDTTRGIGRCTVSAGNAKLTSCLTREALSRFRSIGPSVISVTLVGNETLREPAGGGRVRD